MNARSNLRKLHQFLTAEHPTRYLVWVLIGSCVWFWMVSGYPSVLWSIGNALVVLAFLWLRLGGAIREDLRRVARSQRDPSRRKQIFFRLIGTMTILPLVITFWFVPKTGLLLLVVLVLLLTIPFFLLPGALLPEGWLTKRWIRRRRRAAPR